VFQVGATFDAANAVPANVKLSFYIGAFVFLAAVLWTIVTTKEDPPADLEAFRQAQRASGGFAHLLREIPDALVKMPTTMRRLAVVQFFTWMGLFCMWLHFSNAVPVIFGAHDATSDVFRRGAEWAGVCYAVKDAVTFFAAFALMAAAQRMDRRKIHGVCLMLGAVGLLAIGVIHGEENRYWLMAALALGGVAWASILSMPYAILAGALPPERVGVYMGIFNFFIVLPEILASLFFGGLVKNLLHGNLIYAVMAGGGFMLLAALALIWVPEEHAAAGLGRRPRVE
jgi:maltose/moltooligosaccharide transporter